MYVCMYVCMYISVCVCMYVFAPLIPSIVALFPLIISYVSSLIPVKSMSEVERLAREAALNLTLYEEAAAAAKRSEALLLTERSRAEESSGRLEDMEQEFKDLYMRMGKQGELLLEADMQEEKLAQQIAAMSAEREKEREAEREDRLRTLDKDKEKEREKEAAKERQEIEKNSVLDSERHRMQLRIDSLEHQLTLAVAPSMPSFSQGQERGRERDLEKELEEIKAARDLSELNMRDLHMKVAELEKHEADSEERLVRDVASARYASDDTLLPSLSPSVAHSFHPSLPPCLPPLIHPSFPLEGLYSAASHAFSMLMLSLSYVLYDMPITLCTCAVCTTGMPLR